MDKLEINKKLVDLEIYSLGELNQEINDLTVEHSEDIDLYVKEEFYDEGHKTGYRKIDTYGLSQEDVQTAILLKQEEHLSSIRKMIKFFVILTVIFIVACVIGFFSLASNLTKGTKDRGYSNYSSYDY